MTSSLASRRKPSRRTLLCSRQMLRLTKFTSWKRDRLSCTLTSRVMNLWLRDFREGLWSTIEHFSSKTICMWMWGAWSNRNCSVSSRTTWDLSSRGTSHSQREEHSWSIRTKSSSRKGNSLWTTSPNSLTSQMTKSNKSKSRSLREEFQLRMW